MGSRWYGFGLIRLKGEIMPNKVEIFRLQEKIFILDRKFRNMLKYPELEGREMTPEEATKANRLLYSKIDAEEKLKELLNK